MKIILFLVFFQDDSTKSESATQQSSSQLLIDLPVRNWNDKNKMNDFDNFGVLCKK